MNARRSLLRSLLLVLTLLAGGARALAQEPAPPADERAAPVPAAVREAMMRHDYEEAVELLRALEGSRPDEAHTWLYLRGVAHVQAGQAGAAEEALLAVERRYPDGPWFYKARYARADLYRTLRRYEEAVRIYEEEARRLRSVERQSELAGLYLKFADELSTEPDAETPDKGALDYQRAGVLYQKVLELDAPRDLVDRASFRIGFCFQAAQQWAPATQAYERYLAAFDPTGEGGAARREGAGAHVFEARYRLGQCRLEAGDPTRARHALEDLSAAIADARAGQEPWAGVALPAAAELERLDGDARYMVARAWERAGGQNLQLAIDALERFLERHPQHARSERAAYEIAQKLEQMGARQEDALAAYDAFLARPLPADREQEVLEEAARLQRSALFAKGRLLAGQQRFDRAIETFEDYARRYPTGPDWAQAQQGIVDAEYSRGAVLRQRGELAQARAAWSRFLEDHPLDARSKQVLLDIGELYVAEAERLRDEAREGGRADEVRADLAALFEQAVAQWARVASKYPGSNEASRALYRTGYVQEVELQQLELAIATYRSCDFGSHAGAAAARLQAMTKPSLTVLTERKWRTDEAARVRVQTRNLEALEVELYRLDLEAYFRKHLTHQRIEDLDLDLIAPDRTIEVPLEGYRQYLPLDRELELPVEGAGVWAVTVVGGEMRATTLVIRGDVDVIVKSSRREVLVFAEDMLRDEAASDVRVLVALPGAEGAAASIHELTTGADGVARLELDELATAPEVRVFAARGADCASDGLTLDGLGIAPGRSARGYVYTDREAYRPGQTVSWRAILRDVERGSYGFEPGKLYRVTVADSQGRVFHRERLELSEFGTLHGELALDELAPVGDYTITCQGANTPAYHGGFQVQEFQLQRIELSLSAARPVYYRGETVEVEATAAFYYGEPLAGANVRFGLPDGRVLDARTDAGGHARVSFETRDMLRGGPLGISATLTEEGVHAGATTLLAVTGFELAVELDRDVELAGDRFDLRVRARTPDGEGTGRELVVEVLKRERAADGTWSEVGVQEHALSTDAESGEARLSLAIEQGGHYVLRAHGEDRFGNRIQAERQLLVSGEEDEQRLRILVDGTDLRVGDEVRVELYNRAAAGLAFVTFEAETVLEYRVVRLREGQNELAFTVADEHYPNFALAGAMMRGQSFHTASAAFSVERDLRVSIEPARETWAPGEEASVELRVTDQLGRPVRAELSLAVVDDALFALFPERVTDLRAFFAAGTRRFAEMRTATSCGFRYAGATAKIAQAVLDEAKRVAAAEKWSADRESVRRQLSAAEEMEGLSRLGYTAGRSGPAAPGPVGQSASDDFFLGAGGGGAFGGRFGGKRNKEVGAPRVAEISETAFWTPAVVTDADGRATVRFSFPGQATRWRLTCRGVGPGTLVGSARATVVSRSELFADLRTPAVLTEGDSPRFEVRVHNLTGAAGRAALRLRAGAGEWQRSQRLEVELAADGPTLASFALEDVPAEGELTLELVLEARLGGRDLRDEQRRSVPIRPWGMEHTVAGSGELTADRSLTLALPGDRDWRERTLELYVGPGVDRMLVDEALATGPRPLRSSIVTQADTASELIGVAAVLELLGRTGRRELPDHARLRDRADALVARLIAAQNPDGSWSWSGHRKEPGVESSCRAMLALARARSVALEPPQDTLQRGVQFLLTSFQDASQQSDELKAMIVHALAEHDRGDFGAANRLHRARNQLSPAALCHTALALEAMGRAPMAAELAALIERKALQLPPDTAAAQVRCFWPVEGNSAWNALPLEMTAWALMALQVASPGSEKIAAGAEWLLSQRPWYPPRARGIVVASLARYRGDSAPSRDRFEVDVSVLGRKVTTLELSGGASGEHLRIELADDAPDAVGVELTLRGRGRPVFQAVLRGFSREVGSEQHGDWKFRSQTYLADTPRYRGRAVRTGFAIISPRIDEWQNTVEHLPVGATTRVDVVFYAREHSRLPQEQRDFMIMEVPLPAGTTLLEDSLAGRFESYEVRDGELVVFLPPNRYSWSIQYTLIGAVPGEYRVLPPRIRSAYRPEVWATGEPHELTVLGRGVESPDEYRKTPDELFHRGQLLYEDGRYEEAWAHLSELYTSWPKNIENDPLRELGRMMLFMSIDRGDAAEIVRYFELLKEKDPALYVPFHQVLAIGEAYRELEEFERALLVFRATIEETFGKDLKVAGTLEEQGELAGALDALERLYAEFPDIPAVVETWLTLSDKLLTVAPTAHLDASLRRAGRTRATLSLQGILLLQRFLAIYAEDPLAPEAGLNLVSAHLGLEDYEQASKLAGEMAELYTEPEYADTLRYTRAFAEWYLGDASEALQLLESIAQAEYTDEAGNVSVSPNRDLALYILGQIHHARQEVDSAVEYYERVEEAFADAKQALLDIRRKSIALEEVTVARPGDPVELSLEWRNLRSAELLVYSVDLMTLYLREKNLSNVTGVNLAGIEPTIRRTVALGDGRDLHPRESMVRLELPEAGAYLVICRGDELHSSGLVLVSELELEVAEDPVSGRVRVQVVDGRSEEYLRDVDVRVIGSGNDEFSSGHTDPRGLFVADGVLGTSTIIARHGGAHYAFFRGAEALGQPAVDARARQELLFDAQLDSQGYLKNVLQQNFQNQMERQERFKSELNRDRKGVQVQSVK